MALKQLCIKHVKTYLEIRFPVQSLNDNNDFFFGADFKTTIKAK